MLHHDSADCTIDGDGGVVDGSIALNSWFILLLHSIHGMIFILQDVYPHRIYAPSNQKNIALIEQSSLSKQSSYVKFFSKKEFFFSMIKFFFFENWIVLAVQIEK